MTALATSDQVRAIHTARRNAGLRDDAAYRDVLAGFGVTSSKQLTVEQAATFLDRLNGTQTAAQRPSVRQATGPFAKKLQALWISAWNLGIARDRHDTAMMHLVERQTGIPHTRFLRDPLDAAKAIEAIKAMLVRGGVEWPAKPGPGAINLKRAVVAAQIRRLVMNSAPAPGPEDLPKRLEAMTGGELDAMSRRLGTALRQSLARKTA